MRNLQIQEDQRRLILYLTKLIKLTGGGDGVEDHGGGSNEGKKFRKHCKKLDLESSKKKLNPKYESPLKNKISDGF